MTLAEIIREIIDDIRFDGCWAFFYGARGNRFSFFCVGDYKTQRRLETLVLSDCWRLEPYGESEEFGDEDIFAAIHTFRAPMLPDEEATADGCEDLDVWESITMWEEPAKPGSPFSWTYVTSDRHDYGCEGLKRTGTWHRADYPWSA